MRKLASLLCFAALLVLGGAPAWAGQSFFHEVGISLYADQSFDLDDDLYSLGVRLALVAPWFEGDTVKMDFRLEGQQGVFRGHDRGVEIALVPAVRAYFKWWTLRPYAECGFGLSYHSLDIYELGTDFNFLSFVGLGVSFPINDRVHLELGYRMRHISNAGLDDRNHGVTSNQAQLEVGWSF